MADRTDYQRGLEDAALIADFYAKENSRLATDTWMVDPARDNIFSDAAKLVSERLAQEGFGLSSAALAASKVAILIRQQVIDGPDAGLASVLCREDA